ncbi:MAG: TetR-like C-terminal domain-containing protein [Gemmatimonadota bacterium]
MPNGRQEQAALVESWSPRVGTVDVDASGLVSAMAEHEAVASAVREGFLAARRAALRSVLGRGVDRCELRRDIDLELALDFLGGPLFYRLLVTGGPLDDRLAEGTVDIMLRGLACPA